MVNILLLLFIKNRINIIATPENLYYILCFMKFDLSLKKQTDTFILKEKCTCQSNNKKYA